jgi:hypothetical protein
LIVTLPLRAALARTRIGVVDIELDDSEWPIVRARWRGAMTDATLTAMLVRLDGWLERRQRIGLLIDARGSRGLTPEQRRKLVAHMKEHREPTAAFLVQAVVMDNLVARTLYWAVQMLVPPPFPSKAFDDPESARAWLLERLSSAS